MDEVIGTSIKMVGPMPMNGMLGRVVHAMVAGDEPAMDASSEELKVGGRVTQWATDDDQVFYAVGKTSSTLPPGAYEVGENRGQLLFRKFDIDVTGLMRLPDTHADKILAEIEKFWSRADRFEKYKITQRRGILIAGPTGCGKTCTGKLVCVDVVKRGGIVIPFVHPRLLVLAISQIRLINPEVPIVVLMEDLDAIAGAHRDDSSDVLNMLDGVYASFRKVVFVAMTNNPERLEARITNRPSRFDCVVVMENPSEESRLKYLQTLVVDEPPFDIKKAAEDTNGMSFAHLKELFTSVAILDFTYEDALAKVKKMAEEDLPTGEDMELGPVPAGAMGFLGASNGDRPKRRRKHGY